MSGVARTSGDRAGGDRADAEVAVLYQDEYVCAVDKPAGIIVHGDGTGVATLTDMVAARLGEGFAPQALQRLDRDTTGIVLFSLDKEAQPKFDALVSRHGLADGGIRKRYLAVVRGKFPAGTTVIDRPIGRDRHDSRRMRVSKTGKPSRTTVEPLAQRAGRSLLLVELGTGRKHQIRVHLSAMGFAIEGDELYGAGAADPGMGRGTGGRRGSRGKAARGLMLHAAAEDFVHPVTGEAVHVRTEFPARFGAFFSPADASVLWA